MKVLNYVEREDGGADLEVDLTAEETQLLIQYALISMINNSVANILEPDNAE